MKPLYAISQDILNCDPRCVKHHLLPGCFNNRCGRNDCRIKRDVDALKFKQNCKCYKNKAATT